MPCSFKKINSNMYDLQLKSINLKYVQTLVISPNKTFQTNSLRLWNVDKCMPASCKVVKINHCVHVDGRKLKGSTCCCIRKPYQPLIQNNDGIICVCYIREFYITRLKTWMLIITGLSFASAIRHLCKTVTYFVSTTAL